MMLKSEKIFFALMKSPVGMFGLVGNQDSLVEIVFQADPAIIKEQIRRKYPQAREQENALLHNAAGQLNAYFDGRRRQFELPLDMVNLPVFTRRVLTLLSRVDYGRTLTYGDLATLAGSPQAARAVGRAMATNPFPIVVPCHRVVGGGGRLTGYSGGQGVATKQWLLDFEKQQAGEES
ncbi:MAG: methylated-DNA--[protein]-cysteine S-methyltransferase [Desulfuromonadales bacterium]|nr:methylated-DNA--[protein]-cysteine S-methyltransferase [Desulfuromonadales bacterium]MDW7758477.1 methylated-DNA--[protein]-cysteine S-methyltransferase [Desulfuromonadales bacterium]